jgi:Mg-chelatase subunit ChlI
MAEMEVDGHRGDIVILKTALAHAAFNERTKITQEDILIAAELALPHRLKRQPFQDTSTQLEELSEKLEQVRQEATEQTQQMVESAEMADSFEEKKTKVKK